MNAFILLLDPVTRDELYSDADITFIELILIEALVNIIQVMINPSDLLPNEDGLTCDDPEAGFLWSVDYLLHVIQETNKKEGVVISEEDVSYNSEFYDMVSTRLGMAIESIRAANCLTQLSALRDLFVDQAMGKDFRYKASHLGTRVVFTITPEL